VYAVVGDRDFNHDEVRELDETLDGLGVVHRVEAFAGAHEWPPAAQAGAAVRWLEVQAMRDGRAPVDADLVQELWASDLERARRAESAGDVLEAHRLYAALAVELGGLRDVSEAAGRAAALGASPEHARAARAERERRRTETLFLERARQTLSAADPTDASSVPRTIAALGLRELKEQSRAADDPVASAAAARRLNTVLVQTGFYLPRKYRESGDHVRAAFFLALAVEIEPDDPDRWVALAAARSRAGQRDAALAALEKAVALGWTDVAGLEDDASFRDLRSQPRFERLLRAMKAAPGGG
jgi:tetratricopeptide (TPR) repeat protein